MSKRMALFLVISLAIFGLMHGMRKMVGDLPYILYAIITAGMVIGVLIIVDKWFSGASLSETVRAIGFHKTPWKTLVPALVISLLLLIMYPVLAVTMRIPIMLEKDWFLNLLGLCFTAGLMEESFFRGFVFRHFRARMAFRPAAIASMVFFSFAHLLLFTYMEWPIALVSTILAVVSSWPLAYLFEKGHDTLWGAALLHTVIRTIGMVVITTPEAYMALSMQWILLCMVVPYAVLLFHDDFRSTFSLDDTQRSNPNNHETQL